MGTTLVVVRRRRSVLGGAGRPVLEVVDLAAGTGALTAGLVAAGLSVELIV